MPYVKKLDKLKSGPQSWENSEEIPLSDIGGLLNHKTLAPEFSTSDMCLVRTDQVTKTFTFTAPEDLTLKRLVMELVDFDLLGQGFDYSYSLGVSRLTVISGTGPDVSYNVFEGNSAASMGLFSIRNIGFTPLLNIRMAAGDVLEMDVIQGLYISSSISTIPANMYFTYEEDIDYSVSPKKILGGSSVADFFQHSVASGSVAATATITVNSAPATSNNIRFNRLVANNGISPDSNPVLSPGTGTSGTDTYDNTIGTISALRNNLVSVLNDASNSFDGDWTASPGVGSDEVTITQNSAGASGNYDFIETSGEFSATAFSGGTSVASGVYVFTPTVDIVITDIYYSCITDENQLGPVISPSYYYLNSFEITEIEINGSPASTGRSALPPMGLPIGIKKINVPVSAGETVRIFSRAGYAREAYTAFYTVVAELA